MIDTKKINIKKLENDAKIPTYGTDFSAGCDLYACSKEKISFNPGETKLIKTGIAMELPEGYAGLIYGVTTSCAILSYASISFTSLV